MKNIISKAADAVMKVAASLRNFVRRIPDFIKKIPFYIKNFPSFAKTLPDRAKKLRNFAKTRFKAFIYSDVKEKPSLPKRRTAVIVSAAALLFALYYMGLFDISFITRPSSWKNNSENLFSIWNKGENDEPSSDDARDETEAGNDGKEEETHGETHTVELPENFSGRDETEKIDKSQFKTREELAEEGYYLTDAAFEPSVSTLGSIKFSFDFPALFSYRNMQMRDWIVTEYDDGRMSTVEDATREVERPALYLYMGYLIYDDAGQQLYIMDRNGSVIMTYDESYLPAFARNRNGEPLFYSTYGYYTDVPAGSEINEAKEETVNSFVSGYVTDKNYYTISNGYFAADDYIEERDGRGLNFDFPASYGLSDTYNKVRTGIMTARYSTFLDGTNALVRFMNLNYFDPWDPNGPNLEEILQKELEYASLPIKDKLKHIKKKTTFEDTYKLKELLPYYAAYNYREGYAAVITDKTDEEPKYETKELRVINTAGEITFASPKKYYNKTLKDYCSDRYLLPLSKGEESIGHLYFDHGLMRLRKVTYDWYQLDEFKVLRVNSDRDVLVHPNGTEFPIPEGFTLKAYSDGILTLEKNGLFGYMDINGKWIADPKFTDAAAFHGGIGVIKKRDGKVGAVDTAGNIVIPFRYSYISNRSDELITAYSEAGGWELLGVFSK